mmetsp:Transcript_35398/g.56863  ORF Transcript_35398/g.56863 Transcript_35398/m.56863 type:complete len:285 (+) Transcript_35398:40-894(+)
MDPLSSFLDLPSPSKGCLEIDHLLGGKSWVNGFYECPDEAISNKKKDEVLKSDLLADNQDELFSRLFGSNDSYHLEKGDNSNSSKSDSRDVNETSLAALNLAALGSPPLTINLEDLNQNAPPPLNLGSNELVRAQPTFVKELSFREVSPSILLKDDISPQKTLPSLDSGEVSNMHKPKRRRRARMACDSCHSRKTKCDAGKPCSLCKKLGRECVYTEAKARRVQVRLKPAVKKRLADLDNKHAGKECTRTAGCLRPYKHPGHCRTKPKRHKTKLIENRKRKLHA